MSKLSRILIAVASILLGGMFAFPIWRISLLAPQYPEGLGMLIRVNTVAGVEPNDLSNINELNHYIGMRAIEPSAIPELRIMPWVVGALIVGGLLVALIGRRGLLWTWVAAFGAFAVAGLVDFWRWEYSYGHDLDLEHAIIKVPGMTYQPPLVGEKQLLNFTAASWPDVGALLAFAAFALALIALFVARRGTPRPPLAVPAGADRATDARAAARVISADADRVPAGARG